MAAIQELIKQDAVNLISALGYTMQDKDSWLIDFFVQTAESRIKNSCNIPDVPMELKEPTARLAVGEFFNAKKGMGELQGFDINFDAVPTQVKEGDTSVSFGSVATPEQRLDALISSFMSLDEAQLARFRRLVW